MTGLTLAAISQIFMTADQVATVNPDFPGVALVFWQQTTECGGQPCAKQQKSCYDKNQPEIVVEVTNRHSCLLSLWSGEALIWKITATI